MGNGDWREGCTHLALWMDSGREWNPLVGICRGSRSRRPLWPVCYHLAQKFSLCGILDDFYFIAVFSM